MRQKGVLQISNPTANVTFSISGLAVYTITPTLTNCTAQAGNPTTIEQGGTAQLTFLFDGTNYKCPTTAPTVTNATGTWVKVSNTKGNLTLSNPSGAVSFSVVGEAIQSNYVGRIGSSPAGFIYVKINGTVSLSNYDLITLGNEDISIPKGSYFTISDGLNDPPGAWDIWFDSTYSRNITGTPATQDGTNLITATPLANDWFLSFGSNF